MCFCVWRGGGGVRKKFFSMPKITTKQNLRQMEENCIYFMANEIGIESKNYLSTPDGGG